ncbi:Uncharacterised protein [Citrobacter youngae]|jgi:hypothetical protein|nr:Uncharacterised protein [Citrobacter youngae]
MGAKPCKFKLVCLLESLLMVNIIDVYSSFSLPILKTS